MARGVSSCVVMTVLALGLVACIQDFEPAHRVQDLRVLAVRAEPPEITDPGTSILDALVVGGQGEITYRWELCAIPAPPGLGQACLVDAMLFPLGSDPTATVQIPDLDDLVAAPETQGFFLDLEAGLVVQVRLEVTDESGRSVQAVKSLSISRGQDLNANPTLLGMRLDQSPWPDGETPVVPISRLAHMEPAFDLDAAEAYEGPLGPTTESFLFSWFADGGRFDTDRTLDTDPANRWTPPGDESDAGTEEVRVWVVLRDGRGGVDWVARALQLTEDG